MNKRSRFIWCGEWLKWLYAAGLVLDPPWAASGLAKAASDPWLVENGTVRLLRIAGHGYAVPLNYMDLPRKPGLDQDGLLLTMLWPGLEPRTPENLREFTHVPGWGRRVNVLIQDNPNRLSGERLVRIALDTRQILLNPLVQHGREFGLTHFLPESAVSNSRKDDFEFFVEGSLEAPAQFIRCSRPDTVPKPGCSLTFVHNGTRMSINFERIHLPEWQTLRSETLRLLTCFSTNYVRHHQMD